MLHRIGRHSLGTGTVKYAAGRELLVLVGEKTIRYNNILGQSLEGAYRQPKTGYRQQAIQMKYSSPLTPIP